MAVYNDYVDAKILDERTTSAIGGQGSKLVSGRVVFSTTASHDANSIYRVLRGIPSTAVFDKLKIWTKGVTGMSDVDAGLYKPNRGADAGDEVGSEVLASTLDLSSAITRANAVDGLANVVDDADDFAKSLWELGGETIDSRQQFYDIGLKAVAAPTEADTIVVEYAYFAP